jgi:hypothetical protein
MSRTHWDEYTYDMLELLILPLTKVRSGEILTFSLRCLAGISVFMVY